jgi:spore coat polysaccharide biosynthesis protein SpsF
MPPCFAIIIKKATEQDAVDLWQWRNDPLTRQMSITTNEVNWQDHLHWFNNSLTNDQRSLYIGYVDNEFDVVENKVGMCRFDIDDANNTAEISINLNPHYRNKKLSSVLLQSTIDAFFKIHKIDLLATIKKQNAASDKCFRSCGFQLSHDDHAFNYYRLSAR